MNLASIDVASVLRMPALAGIASVGASTPQQGRPGFAAVLGTLGQTVAPPRDPAALQSLTTRLGDVKTALQALSTLPDADIPAARNQIVQDIATALTEFDAQTGLGLVAALTTQAQTAQGTAANSAAQPAPATKLGGIAQLQTALRGLTEAALDTARTLQAADPARPAVQNAVLPVLPSLDAAPPLPSSSDTVGPGQQVTSDAEVIPASQDIDATGQDANTSQSVAPRPILADPARDAPAPPRATVPQAQPGAASNPIEGRSGAPSAPTEIAPTPVALGPSPVASANPETPQTAAPQATQNNRPTVPVQAPLATIVTSGTPTADGTQNPIPVIGGLPTSQSTAPGAPQSNPPAAPQANVPAAPQANAPTAPQANAPTAPQANAPAAPQANVPIAPQANAPIAPQANAPIAPQANAPIAPQANAPAAPQANAPLSVVTSTALQPITVTQGSEAPDAARPGAGPAPTAPTPVATGASGMTLAIPPRTAPVAEAAPTQRTQGAPRISVAELGLRAETAVASTSTAAPVLAAAQPQRAQPNSDQTKIPADLKTAIALGTPPAPTGQGGAAQVQTAFAFVAGIAEQAQFTPAGLLGPAGPTGFADILRNADHGMLAPLSEAANRFEPAPAQKPDSPAPSRFASVLSEQIRAAQIEDGLTRIELSPRSLGAIEIELATEADGTTNVVIRAENASVLTALRDARDHLAQMLSMTGGGSLSFEDKPTGQGGGEASRGPDTGLSGESDGAIADVAGPARAGGPAIIDGRQLDITT